MSNNLSDNTQIQDEPLECNVLLQETAEDAQLDYEMQVKNISPSEATCNKMEYGLEDKPPWHIVALYSFQQVSLSISGPLTMIMLVGQSACIEGRDGGGVVLAKLLSTSFFMVGLASLMQTTLGVRLPVLQGCAVPYLIPVIAMTATNQWTCPPIIHDSHNSSINDMTDMRHGNDSSDLIEPWIPKLKEINGCLMCAALVQIFLGCSGAVGLLLNFIGPLTLGPTLSLLGISLAEPLTKGCAHSWIVSGFTVTQLLFYSLILGKIKTPCLTWHYRDGISVTYIKAFKLFPFLFTIILSWILSCILTATGVFPSHPEEIGYLARTDSKVNIIYESAWVHIPYPGEWGFPTVSSIGILVGFMCAAFASTIESIADYYATARVVQTELPPKHAVNRGILIEGINSLICGFLGATVPTTSYSSVIGFISLTGVGSRFVWQMMSILLILLGLFGKAGAILSTIPQPIVSTASIVMLSMVTATGISLFQYVDLSSSRNLLIIGMTHMFGIALPNWINKNPHAINTGSEGLDQALTVLMGSGIIVAGGLGLFLDNILPGTKEERGMLSMMNQSSKPDGLPEDNVMSNTEKGFTHNTYDIPYITKYLHYISCFKYVPFLPTFVDNHRSCCQNKEKNDL